MLNSKIPEGFLNNLPSPILIVSNENHEVNHEVVFANESFTHEFGWQKHEILDKNTWWELAYPDAEYRQVVERQWELAVESTIEQGLESVTLTVNIMTKYEGQKRYEVSTQLTPIFDEHYYTVIFKPCS